MLVKHGVFDNDGFAYTHLDVSIFYVNPDSKNLWTENDSGDWLNMAGIQHIKTFMVICTL